MLMFIGCSVVACFGLLGLLFLLIGKLAIRISALEDILSDRGIHSRKETS